MNLNESRIHHRRMYLSTLDENIPTEFSQSAYEYDSDGNNINDYVRDHKVESNKKEEELKLKAQLQSKIDALNEMDSGF